MDQTRVPCTAARGEGERVLALESREGTRASRRVEEGLSRALSGGGEKPSPAIVRSGLPGLEGAGEADSRLLHRERAMVCDLASCTIRLAESTEAEPQVWRNRAERGPTEGPSGSQQRADGST